MGWVGSKWVSLLVLSVAWSSTCIMVIFKIGHATPICIRCRSTQPDPHGSHPAWTTEFNPNPLVEVWPKPRPFQVFRFSLNVVVGKESLKHNHLNCLRYVGQSKHDPLKWVMSRDVKRVGPNEAGWTGPTHQKKISGSQAVPGAGWAMPCLRACCAQRASFNFFSINFCLFVFQIKN